MGVVLSGLLTGILASRVVSGYVGEWLGWREMFFIAALVMVLCMALTLKIMPQIKSNYVGTYRGLMASVFNIVRSNGRIRLYAIRAAFSFGSMMAIWSCLAFRLAQAPFFSGSEMVGTLGLCGIAGAIAASGVGKLVNRWGIRKMSIYGACLQLVAWADGLSVWRHFHGTCCGYHLGRYRLAMSATKQSKWLHSGDASSLQQSQHHIYDHLFYRRYPWHLLCRIGLDTSCMDGCVRVGAILAAISLMHNMF